MDHVHVQGPAQKTQSIHTKMKTMQIFFDSKKKNTSRKKRIVKKRKKIQGR